MPRDSSSAETATAFVTMGGQAQVVTFALDDLLSRGERISKVLVLHLAPDNPRVRRALSHLSTAFAGGQYQGHPTDFRHLAVQIDGAPLSLIHSDREAEAVWEMARDLITELKRAGQKLHLCIAGGPRLLALTLTSAAMLQCDHRDRLWHLYTPREFLAPLEQASETDNPVLHAPQEWGVRLVPVPMVPWGACFPALRMLSQPPAVVPQLLDPADAHCCATAWGQLTERQREVLRVLAEGLSPQEAAEQLCITLKTLDTHKTEIFAECRNAWDLPEDERLTYHFLREKFGPWTALLFPDGWER